jgi:hypothetical protein
MATSPTQLAETEIQPVPDFFQSFDNAAQLAQVGWLEKTLTLDDNFFARTLDVSPSMLEEWRGHRCFLHPEARERLIDLWSMFLHLFSFLNHDYGQVQTLFESPCRSAHDVKSRQLPPWAGHSIREHLERNSPRAIDDVSRWVTSFRFADRYGT